MKRWLPWLIASTVWLGGAVFGLILMFRYQTAPGTAAAPPPRWPAASRIERTPGKATLVMTVHPQCPCTRASMGELALLMARCQDQMKANVLFLKPSGFGDEWVKSDLWTSAARIPGVTVLRDDNGEEAKRFHAATSGETVLYDADGKLLFSGGITSGRGHSGDNAGRTAIVSLLSGGGSNCHGTFVYGCSLVNPINVSTQSICCKK